MQDTSAHISQVLTLGTQANLDPLESVTMVSFEIHIFLTFISVNLFYEHV